MSLYTEKMHIWEKGILRDIIMVIYRGFMNFIFIDQDIKFMKHIDIMQEIEEVLVCTMDDDAALFKPKPVY